MHLVTSSSLSLLNPCPNYVGVGYTDFVWVESSDKLHFFMRDVNLKTPDILSVGTLKSRPTKHVSYTLKDGKHMQRWTNRLSPDPWRRESVKFYDKVHLLWVFRLANHKKTFLYQYKDHVIKSKQIVITIKISTYDLSQCTHDHPKYMIRLHVLMCSK